MEGRSQNRSIEGVLNSDSQGWIQQELACPSLCSVHQPTEVDSLELSLWEENMVSVGQI